MQTPNAPDSRAPLSLRGFLTLRLSRHRKIMYAEVKPEMWAAAPSLQQPTITFTVEYTMDSEDFWTLCGVSFAVLIAFIGLTGLWRLRNWYIRTSHYKAPATIEASNIGFLELPPQPITDGKKIYTRQKTLGCVCRVRLNCLLSPRAFRC